MQHIESICCTLLILCGLAILGWAWDWNDRESVRPSVRSDSLAVPVTVVELEDPLRALEPRVQPRRFQTRNSGNRTL